jgi:hypothetical protein
MNYRLISHRGNLNGPDESRENNPLYVAAAIDAGFKCEVDLWVIESSLPRVEEDEKFMLFLGHDKPQYRITEELLLDFGPFLFVHCKNADALLYCKRNPEWIPEFFWHQTDQYTMTSLGTVWSYPTAMWLPFPEMQVIACPEMINTKDMILTQMEYLPSIAICTDYPQWYADKLAKA